MKRNVLLRRPWLTAGLVVASLVLVSTLTLAALNLHHVHAAGTGGGGGGYGFGCAPLNGASTCHFSGATAYAEYVQYPDSSGCIYSSAGMMVFDNLQSDQPGGPTGSPTLYVSIFKYDMCNYNVLEDGYGYTTAVDFKHDAALQSASVSATMQISDPYTSTPPINVTVNLTWKGVGSVTSLLDTYQLRTASTLYRTHFKADNRMAVVSGTLSDGTANFAATPTMSTLYNAQGGTLDIIRQ